MDHYLAEHPTDAQIIRNPDFQVAMLELIRATKELERQILDPRYDPIKKSQRPISDQISDAVKVVEMRIADFRTTLAHLTTLANLKDPTGSNPMAS